MGTQATAASALRFLDAMQQRLRFPLKAIPVNGGSEFQGKFEQVCAKRSIRLFVLPLHSPKPDLKFDTATFPELVGGTPTCGRLDINRFDQEFVSEL